MHTASDLETDDRPLEDLLYPPAGLVAAIALLPASQGMGPDAGLDDLGVPHRRIEKSSFGSPPAGQEAARFSGRAKREAEHDNPILAREWAPGTDSQQRRLLQAGRHPARLHAEASSGRWYRRGWGGESWQGGNSVR